MINNDKKAHNYITHFNPDVMLLERAYQDFSLEINEFNAGCGYENFNDFIKNEAIQYKEDGNGVTYVVWNILYDELGYEIKRDIVSYYTLAATSIPYEDKIRKDKEDIELTGEEFDIEICGIAAIEIKMFALDEKYQDLFFKYSDEDLPISAWIMRSIIDYAYSVLNNVLGFKALFLHSLPESEKFYIKNGFNPMEINMQPLHCIDSEYKAMYLALKEVHMNYDD